MCFVENICFGWFGNIGRNRRSWNKKQIIQKIERIIRSGWNDSPSSARSSCLRLIPWTHVEFRCALVCFGGKVVSDNQLCLLFPDRFTLIYIIPSYISLSGLEPLDLSLCRSVDMWHCGKGVCLLKTLLPHVCIFVTVVAIIILIIFMLVFGMWKT